jgi:hypothetical protein
MGGEGGPSLAAHNFDRNCSAHNCMNTKLDITFLSAMFQEGEYITVIKRKETVPTKKVVWFLRCVDGRKHGVSFTFGYLYYWH